MFAHIDLFLFTCIQGNVHGFFYKCDPGHLFFFKEIYCSYFMVILTWCRAADKMRYLDSLSWIQVSCCKCILRGRSFWVSCHFYTCTEQHCRNAKVLYLSIFIHVILMQIKPWSLWSSFFLTPCIEWSNKGKNTQISAMQDKKQRGKIFSSVRLCIQLDWRIIKVNSSVLTPAVSINVFYSVVLSVGLLQLCPEEVQVSAFLICRLTSR